MHSEKLFAAVFASSLLFLPSAVSAQQPLEEFLAASDTAAIDIHSAQAALDTARSQADEARARLLPTFLGLGTYQRNEIQSQIAIPVMGADPIVRIIVPYDQLTATLGLTVPIVDISSWSLFFAAEQTADSFEDRYEATSDDVHATVVQIWHQLVGARAVRDSTQRTLEAVTASRDSVLARFEAQVAPQLELSRSD
jgi:outer membrane protein TolC